MTFRILCLIEKTDDSIAYYRATLPFVTMTQEYSNVKVDFVNPGITPSWDFLCNYNVLFCQRPSAKEHLDWITYARMHRLRIWIDHDDELWSVNYHSPAYHHYAQKQTQDYIRECLEFADVVSVSTPYLATAVKQKYDMEAVVVENAVDTWMMYQSARLKPFAPVINWRGSHTHKDDLMTHQDQILSFDAKHNVQWVFRGYNETLLTVKLKNVRHVNYMPHTVYQETIRKEEGNIMMVPLTDSSFNRSKSNIAALESIVAGMIPIVPDWWEDINLYIGNLESKLEQIWCEDEETRTKKWVQLCEVVAQKYSLAKSNEVRMQILKNLL